MNLPKPGSIWRFKDISDDQILLVLILESSPSSVKGFRVYSWDQSTSVKDYSDYYRDWENYWELV